MLCNTVVEDIIVLCLNDFAKDEHDFMQPVPLRQQYKFCEVSILTEQQLQWIEKYNGYILGDISAGGDGYCIPTDVWKFFHEDDVWFGDSAEMNVPAKCRVVKAVFIGYLEC